MNQNFFVRFLIRWVVCGLGLWITAAFLPAYISYQQNLAVLIIAGLILAIINSFIKPIVIFLTLPAVLITLGLFMIVVNGLMVWLVAWLYGPLEVTSFWAAMLAGLIIGLVNYLVSVILESKETKA